MNMKRINVGPATYLLAQNHVSLIIPDFLSLFNLQKSCGNLPGKSAIWSKPAQFQPL